MRCRLDTLCIDALDPRALSEFWAGVLQWAPHPAARVPTLLPDADAGFQISFWPTAEPKTLPNQMHFDLTSTSAAQQAETVARALALGGTHLDAAHLDAAQQPEEGHVVLADPEGNEFCVLEAENSFLADCGFLGALASDGTAEVGRFWSRVLGWPLVWDQDEETAVQAPTGGPKITWGGPPLDPRPPRNRFRFDLAPTSGCVQESEVERLVSLGAARLTTSGLSGMPGRVAMADPDGNEFGVLPG